MKKYLLVIQIGTATRYLPMQWRRSEELRIRFENTFRLRGEVSRDRKRNASLLLDYNMLDMQIDNSSANHALVNILNTKGTASERTTHAQDHQVGK